VDSIDMIGFVGMVESDAPSPPHAAFPGSSGVRVRSRTRRRGTGALSAGIVASTPCRRRATRDSREIWPIRAISALSRANNFFGPLQLVSRTLRALKGHFNNVLRRHGLDRERRPAPPAERQNDSAPSAARALDRAGRPD
jgi:hypothetical protein